MGTFNIPGTNKSIGGGKCFVVAEIGKNFIQTEENKTPAEYLENAKFLVKAAKEALADAVKFQTHNVEDEQLNLNVDSPHFKGHSRYLWVKRNDEATPLDTFWRPLQKYCQQIGLVFFSTPMSRGAAQKLQMLDVPMWKVASSDILDFPMLSFMTDTQKLILIPTGMSTMEELDTCVNFLKRKQAKFIIMHAISRYPYPSENSQLSTITFLQKRYPDTLVGFSQNSPWIEPAVTAVALGAVIVEQHFTLDRTLFGPDHKVSMTPNEFKEMVRQIRDLEKNPNKHEIILAQGQKYLGKETKILQEGEEVFRPLFRKGLVAGCDIDQGTTLSANMVNAMRPQAYFKGAPSENYEKILGRKTKINLKRYDPITLDILE